MISCSGPDPLHCRVWHETLGSGECLRAASTSTEQTVTEGMHSSTCKYRKLHSASITIMEQVKMTLLLHTVSFVTLKREGSLLCGGSSMDSLVSSHFARGSGYEVITKHT